MAQEKTDASIRAAVAAHLDVFQPLLDAGNMDGIAAVMNDPAGAMAGSLPLTEMTKDDFLKAFLLKFGSLLMWLANTNNQQNPAFPVIYSLKYQFEQATLVPMTDPDLLSALATVRDTVPDPQTGQPPLWTDDWFTQKTSRGASFAEIIWGAGATISGVELGNAINGHIHDANTWTGPVNDPTTGGGS